ncbi:MAG TPA: PEGA domain-containing protein [Pyrinomonadaceae bacterium]|nr:PEGA domain-containing protein [Pyrinomonadaceae bacterium]
MKHKQLLLVLFVVYVFACATITPAQERILPAVLAPFTLSADTPVKLRLMETITSASAKLNDTVPFEVVEDVKIGDVIVIARGSHASGTVIEAHSKRSFGRSGKLNVNIDKAQLVSGESVALRSTKGGSGGNHVAVMTTAVVATAIVFFPAAPLLFFIKGKNITIPKGTEIISYISGQTPLEITKFAKATTDNPQTLSGPADSQTSTATNNAALSTLLVKSTPDGAEITIDGKYVGSTPSTLTLAAGEHTVKVEKQGFKLWERPMTVSTGGTLTVDATLEKLPL